MLFSFSYHEWYARLWGVQILNSPSQPAYRVVRCQIITYLLGTNPHHCNFIILSQIKKIINLLSFVQHINENESHGIWMIYDIRPRIKRQN